MWFGREVWKVRLSDRKAGPCAADIRLSIVIIRTEEPRNAALPSFGLLS
jgi:hypothetical protein